MSPDSEFIRLLGLHIIQIGAPGTEIVEFGHAFHQQKIEAFEPYVIPVADITLEAVFQEGRVDLALFASLPGPGPERVTPSQGAARLTIDQAQERQGNVSG